ncbi:uncharacterized protein HMPREF1541_00691 [Cyphellophora europaea CBS 101466]|uniref:Fe2OG dioxygenase domain-containing protein n=1 Tax=Cyphellophora europaea (strain CBS 101466) TaxID=1220924 RepID=W2SCQ9_CYPE1|nr:uncharacterized protein HMPREF1541_00691 [Cyphellophora europaea CBS 101466]ETN46506.1 hypothetical protein HMPREF1541_00691 [Cyphellophora europaea CBS 101466]
MERHRLQGLPEAGFYIPNFVSMEEEQYILAEIHRMPQAKWTTLTHRRLMSLPSTLAGPAKDTLLAAPLPKFLEQPIVSRYKALGIFDQSPHQCPNHVLVNEYRPGEGIMPHTDGPAYHTITATVSLGSHTVLDIYKKTDDGEREKSPTWRVLQEPRSLLITTAGMYKDTLHGISEVTIDNSLDSNRIANWSLLGDVTPFSSGAAERKTRVSLTYRDVLKTAKIGGALKFMNRR